MSEQRPFEHIAKVERDIKAERALECFRELVEGWGVNQDGEDLCPDHIDAYRDRIERMGAQAIIIPLKDIAESRRLLDSWYVSCSEKGCRREVAVDYN